MTIVQIDKDNRLDVVKRFIFDISVAPGLDFV